MGANVWTLLMAASYFWVTPSGAFTEFTLCFEDHCYLRSHPKMNWYDSKNFCYDKDARLARIHSSLQNEYIFDNVCLRENCWIGLIDTRFDDDWVWYTGYPVNYTNWNEPTSSDISNQKNHAHMVANLDGGVWDDNNGEYFTCYGICMRPAPTSIPTRSPSSAHPTRKPTTWPTSPTFYPTTQPTLDPTKWPTIPPTAQPKPSVMDQLDVVQVLHMIITIILAIAVCILCCWALPIVRRDARNKRVPEKLRSMRVNDETPGLEGVPLSPGDDTYECGTTTVELHEVKNHRPPATTEVKLQDPKLECQI